MNLKRNQHRWLPLALLLLTSSSIPILVAVTTGAVRTWGGTAAPVFLYAISFAFIAGLQNHLQILLHEGVHRQLHPRPRINDFLANVFCAIPFGGLLHHYRYFHLKHHSHLLDPERDPEVGFYLEQGYDFKPQTRRQKLKMHLLDLCGYHYFQFFFSYNRYLLHEVRAGRMRGFGRDELLATILVSAFFGALIFNGHGTEVLVYWVLPQPTLLFFFLKLQGYGEHTLRRGGIADCTRSPRVGLLGQFFIYPLHSNYHLEHHLYPMVPWYRLPILSKSLSTESFCHVKET